jgi:hypothetical protein
MNYTVMTRHRFASNGLADPVLNNFVEHCRLTNGEIAEMLVDKLKRQRFTDENGRTRYRYGRRGVKLMSQD